MSAGSDKDNTSNAADGVDRGCSEATKAAAAKQTDETKPQHTQWRLERSTDGERFEAWSFEGPGECWFSRVIELDDVVAIVSAGTRAGLARREGLIVAAPEMYAALDGNDPGAPEVIKPLSWIRSLIDDARERGPSPDNDDPDAFYTMLIEVENFHARCTAALAKASQPPAKAGEAKQ